MLFFVNFWAVCLVQFVQICFSLSYKAIFLKAIYLFLGNLLPFLTIFNVFFFPGIFIIMFPFFYAYL